MALNQYADEGQLRRDVRQARSHRRPQPFGDKMGLLITLKCGYNFIRSKLLGMDWREVGGDKTPL